jgi:hypothetical protein
LEIELKEDRETDRKPRFLARRSLHKVLRVPRVCPSSFHISPRSHKITHISLTGTSLPRYSKEGGFFYERWGDAPVHSLAAALFLKPEEIHFFQDIGCKYLNILLEEENMGYEGGESGRGRRRWEGNIARTW